MSAIFNLFYIYDPWLFHVFRMAFLAGLLALGYLAYQIFSQQRPQGIHVAVDSLIAIGALLVVSVIPLLINGTKELGVIVMYVKTLILFVFAMGIYNLFYADANGQAKFVNDLKVGILVQFALGLLGVLGVDFIIDFTLSVHTVEPRFHGSEQEYRLYNLTSSAFFQLSLFYLLLFHFLLAYDAKTKCLPTIFVFLLLCIGLVSGRTFLLLSFVSIFLYFKWRYIPALLGFAALCLALAFFMPDNRYVAHALEPLINLLKISGLSLNANGDFLSDMVKMSSSTDTLVNKHLFMPEISQIIKGDGYYFTPEGRYYGSTDSGFLRQTLYGGIGYVLACAAFTFYFVRKVALNWFEGSWKFIVSTFFILSVCNIKADTYAFPGIMLVLLMFLSLFGQQGKTLHLFKQETK